VGPKKGLAKRVRVVLDTNVLVSALLFTGKASKLVPLWRARRIVLLVSKRIIQEYLCVLSYPKFSLTDLEIQTLFHEEILPFIEVVKIAKPFPLTCRDPADDHFLACAATGRADALVSGDADLLSLRKVGRCPILTLETFLNRFLHS
jgi:putative PIN family toxin of toxin-antitoxin system